MMNGSDSTKEDIFGLEQYSKETLIRLLKTYSRLYIALDGFWYLFMKGEFGNDTALKHDILVWEKMHRRELDGVMDALDIQEKDIRSFLKIFLLTPWFRQVEPNVEFKSPKHVILTIYRCPTLIALEKEDEGREKQICHDVDVDYFAKTAKRFNPDLELLPVKLPPRERKEGFSCQWELKMRS
jgi:hypothetical protein